MTISRRIRLSGGTPDASWMDEGLCREVAPDLFFPNPKSPDVELSQVRRICAACDVREQCLRFALDTREPEGIWAGTTPRQRSLMLRRVK